MVRLIILLTTIALAGTSAFSQGTFKPRDADEEQAWRIHAAYKEGRKKEDDLTRQIAILRRDIANSSVSTIGVFGSDAKDRERLTKMREQLTAEQSKLRKLEADWDQKFYGRYGHLQDSDATMVDPATKKEMDKIEFRLINFPFNDIKKKEPLPGTSPTAGTWIKISDKFWPFISTPNDPDENQEESGSPFDITYINNYYDRNGTGRWQKDTSHASCRLEMIDADRVGPGQKVKVRCSLSYKAEHFTSPATASFWAGEPAITFPNGFKPDGSLYPMWGYYTDAVVRVDAANNSTGEATGEFSFPLGPRSDKSPFCVKLTSGTHGTAAAETCYEWQAGSSDAKRTVWAGQWQSTWGSVSITQNGNNISGTYEHDNGRIVGTVIGNKIVGTWSEGPTFTAPNDAGEFEFTLSTDGNSFSGRWRYGSSGAWQQKEWTGTRAGIR